MYNYACTVVLPCMVLLRQMCYISTMWLGGFANVKKVPSTHASIVQSLGVWLAQVMYIDRLLNIESIMAYITTYAYMYMHFEVPASVV